MHARRLVALASAVMAPLAHAVMDPFADRNCAGYLPAYDELAMVLDQAREGVGGRPHLDAACVAGGTVASNTIHYRLHWPVATEAQIHTRLSRTCTRVSGTISCRPARRSASVELARWFTVEAGLGMPRLAKLLALLPTRLRPGERLFHIGFVSPDAGTPWSVQDHGYALIIARPPLGQTGRLHARLNCTAECRWVMSRETVGS